MENWWVQWISVVTYLLVETKTSDQKACNKRFSVLHSCSMLQKWFAPQFKDQLMVCGLSGWWISTRAPVIPSFSIVFLGSKQVTGRLGLYKGYNYFLSSTFLPMYVRILSPHSLIYITTAYIHHLTLKTTMLQQTASNWYWISCHLKPFLMYNCSVNMYSRNIKIHGTTHYVYFFMHIHLTNKFSVSMFCMV
jgi:hypothetical protein